MTPEQVSQRLMILAGSRSLGSDARRPPGSLMGFWNPIGHQADWALETMTTAPMLLDWMPGGTLRDGVDGNRALRWDQHEPCIAGSIYTIHQIYASTYRRPTVLYMGDPTTTGSVVRRAWDANHIACARNLLLPPIEKAYHPELVVAIDRSGALRVGNNSETRPRWDVPFLESLVTVATEHWGLDFEIRVWRTCCHEQTYKWNLTHTQYIMVNHGQRDRDAYAAHIARFLADSSSNHVACNFHQLRRDWGTYHDACEAIATATPEPS